MAKEQQIPHAGDCRCSTCSKVRESFAGGRVTRGAFERSLVSEGITQFVWGQALSLRSFCEPRLAHLAERGAEFVCVTFDTLDDVATDVKVVSWQGPDRVA